MQACSECEETLQWIAEESDTVVRSLAMLPATDDDEPEYQALYACAFPPASVPS